MTSFTDIDLLRELEPVAAANLDRHLGLAAEWMPHEYVPWSQGRDFDTLAWEPDQSRLSDVAQVAFEVGLLTEDNLPSYHRVIATTFGRDGAWGTWVHRWTAEEGRHAIAMRDYLMVTRGVDPVALERGRMIQMQHGFDGDEKTPLRAIAYVSFQELATRISHRNTGRFTQDPTAEKLLARVAADENLHMIFYRNLITAALEIARSATVRAIAEEIVAFQMPGTGIDDFDRKAKQIARAGIYDLRIHHDEVVTPLLRHWKFFDLDGLDAQAEQARTNVAQYLEAVDGLARKHEEKRANALAAAQA
ncbi:MULTISPECIES: acyl-ACP desaturase [unclassified Frankia]|uniref:acyl-ACP desaturase n=1 Tax=unclassified Frankia TaxID=2632575 RepID=UPI002AD49BDB|nr:MULTISPECIES: acyl-ACP desaturase [unclassified Frankia]